MFGRNDNMKKQIAVLMAAATAVTTVAPVLASADTILHENVSIAEVERKIADALADKYASKTEDGINLPGPDAVKGYENSKYAVILDLVVDPGVNDLTNAELDQYGLVRVDQTIYNGKISAAAAQGGHRKYVIVDAEKVKPLLEKRTSSPLNRGVAKSIVHIVDKGVKENKSTYTTENKHYVATLKNADFEEVLPASAAALKAAIEAKVGDKVVDKVTPDGDKFKVELKSGVSFEIGLNDEVLDFSRPLAKDQELTLENVKHSDAVAKEVIGFAKVENKDKEKRTLDVATGNTDVYALEDVEVHEIEVPTVYTKAEGYTQAGANFVNSLIRAKKKVNNFAFNYKGVNYVLADANAQAVTTEADAKAAIDTAAPISSRMDKVGDKYVLKVNVRVLDKNDKDRFKTLQFRLEGKTEKDLARVYEDLKGDNEVVVGKFVKLAGSDRAATAVEVSKERFGYKEADSVVVVGANALIDGLSAAPLAAAKNAPVLIAGKNGLDNGSLAEIERACKDLSNKTVYIVGGENSVPYAAKKQLEDKFGAVVVRLAGDDRYDTSLEVDHRLVKDGQAISTRFVVGGNGAADAMSASAVAARKNTAGQVAPILVVRKDGIKATTRTYLNARGLTQAYVVGGTSTASTQVFKDIEKVVNQTPVASNVNNNVVKRLAGDDRYATNLAVINEFYKAPKNANGLVVVSGKTQYLVDAQTAGAFAGDRNLAVLLTADKLNKAQEATLANGVLKGLKTNIYQVGGVVSADVMKSVVDILGL